MPRHSETTLSAIKNAVDIVALVGEYLPLRRVGTRYKALCPFHDDNNPSFECNPERQSYKCWSCGAGGDVFDFVMNREHVDFPEALRMLAERAGVTLERPTATAVLPAGPSKTDLFEVNAWAEEVFVKALAESNEVIDYLDRSAGSVVRVPRGFGWGMHRRSEAGFWPRRSASDSAWSYWKRRAWSASPPIRPGSGAERFRGRLIFPIHDERGRTLGFGGRILPDDRKCDGRSGQARRQVS